MAPEGQRYYHDRWIWGGDWRKAGQGLGNALEGRERGEYKNQEDERISVSEASGREENKWRIGRGGDKIYDDTNEVVKEGESTTEWRAGEWKKVINLTAASDTRAEEGRSSRQASIVTGLEKELEGVETRVRAIAQRGRSEVVLESEVDPIRRRGKSDESEPQREGRGNYTGSGKFTGGVARRDGGDRRERGKDPGVEQGVEGMWGRGGEWPQSTGYDGEAKYVNTQIELNSVGKKKGGQVVAAKGAASGVSKVMMTQDSRAGERCRWRATENQRIKRQFGEKQVRVQRTGAVTREESTVRDELLLRTQGLQSALSSSHFTAGRQGGTASIGPEAHSFLPLSRSFSPKIDSLLEQFSGELAHIDLIPPGINEDNLDPEGDIHLVERLLYDNSSPRPPEELNSTESFPPSHIPVEDSDPFMEEIDLFLASDESIPPGIDSDYSDSEGDNLFLERLLHDDPTPLPDIPSPTHVTFPFEDHHDLDFTCVVRVFLPFFTYPVTSSFLLSSGSEDTIFDPGISTFHFSSLKPVAYENPIVIFLFFCFCPKDKGIRGEIPQDHEDPCLFSILQSSGLRSFVYSGILNPDHVQRIENKAKTVQRIENKAKTVYEVVSTRNDPEAHVAASHWWIQLAVT
ncbi:hypothetical protein Tco_1182425, partial [Tanacetum coccineum]